MTLMSVASWSGEVLAIGIVAAIFGAVFVVYWRRVQVVRDREWEARWRQLAWRDRIRIGRTVSRGKRLTDPHEALLAADAARSQRRVIEVLPDVWPLHAGLGAILVTLALVAGELPVLAVAALWFATGLATRAWRRRLIRRLEQGERRNRLSL
jgi:hypothetical protein